MKINIVNNKHEKLNQCLNKCLNINYVKINIHNYLLLLVISLAY